jgi:hypothetical protein
VLLHAEGHALGVALGALHGGVAQHGHELVASVAGHQVHGPGLAHEDFGRCAQSIITRHVAEGVVVPLEVVQIEQNHRQGAPTLRGRELLGQVHLQMTTVREIRERIRKREGAEAGMEPGVLERQRGVPCQALQHPRLVRREGAGFGGAHRERPHGPLPCHEGHHDGALGEDSPSGRRGKQPGRGDLVDDHGLALLHHESNQIPLQGEERPFGRGHLPAGGPDACPILFQEPYHGTVGAQQLHGGVHDPPENVTVVERGQERPGNLHHSLRLPLPALQLGDMAGIDDGDGGHVGNPLQQLQFFLAECPRSVILHADGAHHFVALAEGGRDRRPRGNGVVLPEGQERAVGQPIGDEHGLTGAEDLALRAPEGDVALPPFAAIGPVDNPGLVTRTVVESHVEPVGFQDARRLRVNGPVDLVFAHDTGKGAPDAQQHAVPIGDRCRDDVGIHGHGRGETGDGGDGEGEEGGQGRSGPWERPAREARPAWMSVGPSAQTLMGRRTHG